MRRNRFSAIALAIVVASIATYVYFVFIHPRSTTDFNAAKAILAQIEQWPLLYEGLPHPIYERQVREQEELRWKFIQHIAGYPFYAAPIKWSGGDMAEITELALSSTTYQPFSGQKDCGGFHPDFALVWNFKDRPYQILFCFGCHEAIISDGRLSVRCDIQKEPYERLKHTLRENRTYRPPLAPVQQLQ